MDYEQGFSELWTELGREVIQANLGTKGTDRRKKKIKSTFGEVELNKSHSYIAKAEHSFAISPLLQSHMLEFSNSQPFERGIELLNSVLPAVKMGSSQSQRLMQYYGDMEETEELLTSPGFDTTECQSEEDRPPAEPILYVEVDGGHLPTDDGYRETKVGRILQGIILKRSRLIIKALNLEIGYLVPITWRIWEAIKNLLPASTNSLMRTSNKIRTLKW